MKCRTWAVSCFWGQATLMKAALAMLAFTNITQHLLFPAESLPVSIIAEEPL